MAGRICFAGVCVSECERSRTSVRPRRQTHIAETVTGTVEYMHNLLSITRTSHHLHASRPTVHKEWRTPGIILICVCHCQAFQHVLLYYCFHYGRCRRTMTTTRRDATADQYPDTATLRILTHARTHVLAGGCYVRVQCRTSSHLTCGGVRRVQLQRRFGRPHGHLCAGKRSGDMNLGVRLRCAHVVHTHTHPHIPWHNICMFILAPSSDQRA